MTAKQQVVKSTPTVLLPLLFLPLDAGLKILLTEGDDKEKNFLRKKNLAFAGLFDAVAEMLCCNEQGGLPAILPARQARALGQLVTFPGTSAANPQPV